MYNSRTWPRFDRMLTVCPWAVLRRSSSHQTTEKHPHQKTEVSRHFVSFILLCKKNMKTITETQTADPTVCFQSQNLSDGRESEQIVFMHVWSIRTHVTHHGDVTLLCFAGDPFHSSSDFDLDLAEDGGKTVVSSSPYFHTVWFWLSGKLNY